MSFADNELSVANALPIELFEIAYTGNYWYYTSSDSDIEFEGRTYKALPITHAEIEPSVDVAKAGLEFTFPRDVAFGEAFRIQPPSEVVSFTLKVQNYLIPAEFVVAWRGRVVNVEWQNTTWLKVTVENVFSSLQRTGLRRRYSITCPYALYGSQCRVSRDTHKEITPILGFSGVSVVCQAAVGKADDYYAGGFITYTNGTAGNTEKRMIRSSVGATGTLILHSLPVSIVGGTLANIYAGCDHLITTCDTKFNNKDNCGATPYIPVKNPFGGSTVY